MRAARLPPNSFVTLLLVLAVAALPGCSAVRVVYNQADTLLSWMADDYFDLDHTQKQDLNTRLAPLLIWHRREQLPEYARYLGEIKQRAQRPVTRDDALWLIEGAKARLRVIASKGTPDAAELLSALTPENIKKFQEAQSQMSAGLGRLLAVSENYPDLKANANFQELQAQIEGTENRINVERNKFNAVTNDYNGTVKSFPNNLFAKMYGFAEKPYFAADAAASKAPTVQF